MRVERLNLSSELPVSLQAVEDHIRLLGGDSNVMLEAQRIAMAAAREVEGHAHVALLTQTVRVTLDGWPEAGLEIDLPVAPVLDGATATVTVDGAAFADVELGTGLRPTLLVTLDELTTDQRSGRWVIEYQAGFGSSASDLPPDLAHAVLDQAATLYDERGGFADKIAQALSPHMARIAARYRRVKL